MMDARKLLINLLYLATAQSSELPGWSHRETKKPASETGYASSGDGPSAAAPGFASAQIHRHKNLRIVTLHQQGDMLAGAIHQRAQLLHR